MGKSEAELALILRAKDFASREVNKLHGALGRAAGGVGKLGHAFMALGKLAVFAVITGIVAAAGAIGLATKRAAEEEVGIRRLNAALKANVKGFKGNTDAIEKVIAKREGLAFSDDDLRASLTKLVTKFKDTDKALRIQAVAMDVARLKGIPLIDATNLVSKAMDGNKKILKDLGIQLPKNATATQILAAVQKKAAGQADAYGKTAAGSQQAFQIAMDDLLEDVGTGFLPVMTGFFNLLRTKVIPAVRDIATKIGDWFAKNKPLVDQIKNTVVAAVNALWAAVSKVVTWVKSVIDTISANKDVMNFLKEFASKAAIFFGNLWGAIKEVWTWLSSTIATITSNKDVMTAFGRFWDGLGAAIGFVAEQIGAVQRGINKLAQIIQDNKPAWDILGIITSGGMGGINFGRKAGGGPVHRGVPYIVGEKGPELFTPNSSGTITPNHRLGGQMTRGGGGGGGGGFGGGGLTVQFNSTFPPSPAQAREIVRAINPILTQELLRAPATRLKV